jgi:hypothetical protein
MHSRFRDHRVDLARHDRTARLQRRQFDFAQARERTGIHPAQVVGDLHQRDRQRVELAGQFHRVVLRGDALELVVGRIEFRSRQRRQRLRHRLAETRVGVDAGADRGAADRQAAQALARVSMRARRLQLRRPRAEFLRRTSAASHPSGACARSW